MHDLTPLIPGYIDDVYSSIKYFMPEIYLSILFIVVFITDLIFGKNSRQLCKIVACAGMFLVVIQDLYQLSLLYTNVEPKMFFFNNMLLLTRPIIAFKFVIDVLAFILLFYFDWDHKLRAHKKGLTDLYSIVIASVFGMHLMAMAINLLSIYLSIEMVSLASYLLVAYRSDNQFTTEAGLKYVLFGAASSAIILYGISLLYGFSGSLDLFGNTVSGLVQANSTAVSFAILLV